jgi:DNA-binding SARP family transcriptional activator
MALALAVVDGDPASSARVQARVMGGFRVVVDGRTLDRGDWCRAAAERLVKLLLVTPGHRLGRERAAETLWPGAAPAVGRSGLRKAIHFARRAFGSTGVLVTDGETVALETETIDVDLDHLLGALGSMPSATLRNGTPWRGAAAVVALELGALELLPDDPYEDWLVEPRERIRCRWQRIALDVATRARDEGELRLAHCLVEQLLERDPADEPAHRLAIELYVAEGRRSCARQQLEACRTALRGMLGVDPAPETIAALDGSGASPATVTGGHPQRPTTTLLLRGPAGRECRPPDNILRVVRAAGWQILAWRDDSPLGSVPARPAAARV